jgi:hypothetical protein
LIKMGALHSGLSAYPLERKAHGVQQSHERPLLSGSLLSRLTPSLLREVAPRAYGPSGDSV